MKDLQIGSRVRVEAISTMGYDNSGSRFINVSPSLRSFDAYVIGLRRRYLGRYKKSSGYYSFEEAEEPRLIRTGSVLLWEVRESLTSAAYLVRDEDVEPLPAETGLKTDQK